MKVLENNRNPLLVGRVFLDYLKISKVCPRFLRVDRGSETDLMVTIHGMVKDSIIRSTTSASTPAQAGSTSSSKSQDDRVQTTSQLWSTDTNHVIYGSSVNNITIERFWRQVNDFIGAYFKPQLQELAASGHYDSSEELDRKVLAYLYVPIIQNEVDNFIYQYNSHRIRLQKGVQLPTGHHPDFCYRLPEKFGARRCGLKIPDSALMEVEKYWKLDTVDTSVEITDPVLSTILNRLAPDPLKITLNEVPENFISIKRHIDAEIARMQ